MNKKTFKDFLQSDLNVFFNPSEFGEFHTLGSKEILMIIEEDGFDETKRRSNDFDEVTQNIYESMKTIYLKSSDYNKSDVGKRVTLDGEKYYVVSSSVSGGILRISLSANESYG
ncbi:hypothetical protein ACNQFZ_18480 [Schinkia sp. CFF1]